jgi:hypothetical protein
MNWIMKLLKRKKVEKQEIVPVLPKPVPDVRSRLTEQGYRILELPMRSGDVVRGYKIVVSGKGKTMSVEAKTADEGVNMLGKMLGLIAR